jgi:hypothetical protein
VAAPIFVRVAVVPLEPRGCFKDTVEGLHAGCIA